MRLRQILLIDDNDIDNYINRHILETNNVCDSIVTMISAIDALEYLNPIKDDPKKISWVDISGYQDATNGWLQISGWIQGIFRMGSKLPVSFTCSPPHRMEWIYKKAKTYPFCEGIFE